MRTRLIAPLAVLLLVLAGAASTAAATGVFESNDSHADRARDLAERGTEVAGATTPTTPTTSTVVLPETSLPPTSVAVVPGTTQTFAAGDAGSVTVRSDAGTLTVLSANANPGFTGEVERGTGTEVEVQFDNGAVRVDFNAELEDGAVRVRVRVGGVAVENPGTTPTTTPEIDDNADNSGSGNSGSGNSGSGNSGSGNSGPGNGPEAEDNRGPGNAHDDGDGSHDGDGSDGSDGSDDGNTGSGNSGSGSGSGSGHSGSGH